MRKLTILLFAVLMWLQYSLWFGKNGLSEYNRISNDIAMQQKINAKLKERNDRLFSEIKNLNIDHHTN